MPVHHRDARITIVAAEDRQYLAALYLRGGILVAQAYGSTPALARAALVLAIPDQAERRIADLQRVIARMRDAAAAQWSPPANLRRQRPASRATTRRILRDLARSARSN